MSDDRVADLNGPDKKESLYENLIRRIQEYEANRELPLRQLLEADPAVKDVDAELRRIKADADKDAYELEWWRTFACRFQGSNLPKVGTPLHGYRFRLYVDEKGNYVPWGEEPRNVTVWCVTCRAPIVVHRMGQDGPAIGPACPCGKSEGITWEQPA